MKSLCFALASLAGLAAASADHIPAYLQEGISKFQEDASYPEQAEILIALVLTGHVGSNLHKHRMQLHQAGFPGASVSAVHAAKARVIQPLDQVFQQVEDAHKTILAHVQLPIPRTARKLPEAIASIAVVAATLEKISASAPAAAVFFTEMHASLVRALQLKEFVLKVPGIASRATLGTFVQIDEENQHVIDTIASVISQGYNSLAAINADALKVSFATSEFNRIWEN